MNERGAARIDVDAVMLDVGNTLVDLDYELIATVARVGGVAATTEAVRCAEHAARAALDRRLSAEGSSTESSDTLATYLQLVFAELGSASSDAWRPLLTLRRLLWTRPAPAAAGVLETLSRRGYRLAAVSNSDGTVARLLASLGLAEHLDLVIDSGAVGIEKPDPRVFELALDGLGVTADRALHVGDLLHVDVAGAIAAGLHAVLLDPAGVRDSASAISIQRLEDLLDLLPSRLPEAGGGTPAAT